jgi:hypothetical protein
MKRHPTHNNRKAPEQINIPLTPADLTDPDKLILVARKNYATNFPNERRIDCPAPGVIQSARVDRMPREEIRAHLFRCSECFNEYRAAMRDHYRQTAVNLAVSDWRSKTRFTRRPSTWLLSMLAGATAVIMLVTGVFVWRGLRTESPQSSQTRPQRSQEALADKPLTPGIPAQPAEQPPANDRLKPRLIGSLSINLDLSRRYALGDNKRGGSAREPGAKIKLPPRRAILKLRLRQGSEAGFYQISIVDPNSNPLVKTRARSNDGRSLEAVLDLRRASQMAHRLRVERGDDLNEYLIEIAEP